MNLKDLLATNSELLAAPQVACKLTRLLKESPFNEDIVAVVQYDPALTARLLQVCNTAIFRGRDRVSSLEEAVSRLGFDNILRIVWQISMGDKMCAPLPVYGMEIGTLWRHSITTAIAAEELWKLTSEVKENVSTAFTAGLLHDLGKIMINLAMLPKSEMLNQYSTSEHLSPRDAERALLGLDHAELGGELLKHWGQTEALVTAVADHHSPTLTQSTPLCCLVHLADVCTHALGCSFGWGAMSVPLVDDALHVLKIEVHQLEEVMLAVRMRAEEVEVFMSIL